MDISRNYLVTRALFCVIITQRRELFSTELRASIFVGKPVTKVVLDTKDLTLGMVTQDKKLLSYALI